MNQDIFKGIGVVKLTLLVLHFTFAPKCLATVTFRYRHRSDRPECNGSEVLVYTVMTKSQNPVTSMVLSKLIFNLKKI